MAPWRLVASAALLGVGAHLANVLPDIGDDLRQGIRGWPQRLGPAAVRLLPAPLVGASALLNLAPPGSAGRWGPAVLAAVVVAAVGGALVGRSRPACPSWRRSAWPRST